MQIKAIKAVTKELGAAVEKIDFDYDKEGRPAERIRESYTHIKSGIKKMVQGNVIFKHDDTLRSQLKRNYTSLAQLRKLVINDRTTGKKANRILRSVSNDMTTLISSLNEITDRRMADMPSAAVTSKVEQSGSLRSLADLKEVEEIFTTVASEPPDELDYKEKGFQNFLVKLQQMQHKYAGIKSKIPTTVPDDVHYTLFTAPIWIMTDPDKAPLSESALDRSNLPYEIVDPGVVLEDQVIMGFDLEALKGPEGERTLKRVIKSLKARKNKAYVNATSETEAGYFRMPGSSLGYIWLMESRALDRLGSLTLVYVNFPFVDSPAFIKGRTAKPGDAQSKMDKLKNLREKMDAELKAKMKAKFDKLEKLQTEKAEYVSTIAKYRAKAPKNDEEKEDLETNRSALALINKKIALINEAIQTEREKLLVKYREKL